jgi:hypothetical protein
MEKIFEFCILWILRVLIFVIFSLTFFFALLFCIYLVRFFNQAIVYGDSVWREQPVNKAELVMATSFIVIALFFKSKGIAELFVGHKKKDNESK